MDEADCRYAQDIIATYQIRSEIFLSPVYGSDYTVISKFILVNNLPVRFQLQLHKIIGVK
jgi:7-carboxy-7-deazaguanine synthase